MQFTRHKRLIRKRDLLTTKKDALSAKMVVNSFIYHFIKFFCSCRTLHVNLVLENFHSFRVYFAKLVEFFGILGLVDRLKILAS